MTIDIQKMFQERQGGYNLKGNVNFKMEFAQIKRLYQSLEQSEYRV